MSTFARARAEDVRALAGAIVLGSGAGLLVGGAFLATGVPAKPTAPARLAPTVQVQAAAGKESGAPTPSPAAHTPGAIVTAALRGRFQFALPTPFAARPFQFPRVAEARNDLQCLTEAVYFEARGEDKAGQQAVAQVVLNRVRHPAFPKTICGVVHQRTASSCQFTFACSTRSEGAIDNSAWRRAQTIASAALHGAVMAAVGDATHFQTARSGPFDGLMKVAQIGAHIFYRFGGHAGSAGMFHQTPAPSAPAKLEFAKAEAPPATPAAATPKTTTAPAEKAPAPAAAAPAVVAHVQPVAVTLVATATETKAVAAPATATPKAPGGAPARAADATAIKPTVVALAQQS